jgi:hypothetical protein
MVTDACSTPVNPKTPAMMAMIKKTTAHFSIGCSLVFQPCVNDLAFA